MVFRALLGATGSLNNNQSFQPQPFWEKKVRRPPNVRMIAIHVSSMPKSVSVFVLPASVRSCQITCNVRSERVQMPLQK